MQNNSLNKLLTISVIIPAHNEAAYIGACIESVLQHGHGYVQEIIVIDNNSTDTTHQVASSYPGVRVISEKTPGVTHARQAGYKHATGDLLVCLDADTHITADYFPKVHTMFTRDAALACVSGPYSYYDASIREKMFGRIYRYFSYVFMYLSVGYLGVGGNMILRKTVLDQMHGFDTTIVFYGDDTDTARRAKKIGKTLFSMRLSLPSSFRRFRGQGIWATVYLYCRNAAHQIFFHKPYSTSARKYR